MNATLRYRSSTGSDTSEFLATTRFISRRRLFGSHFTNRQKRDAMTSRNDYFVARVTLEKIGNYPASKP